MLWAISVFMVFFSCKPDPILQKAENLESKSQKSISNQQIKTSSKKKTTQHTPKKHVVKKGDPPPIKEHVGKKGEPTPKDPLGNGPKIKITGEIKVKNWSKKPIRVNIFDGDHQKGEKAQIVVSEWVKSPGKFSIVVPKGKKSLWIEANIDEDEDGKPGPKDPIAWYSKNPLSSDKNHDDITLTLEVFVEPKE